MKWYYVDAGQQAGPVEDEQFRQLVLEGRIRAETLVWRDGMPQWIPYQQVFEQSQAGYAQGAGPQSQQPGQDQAACVECGRVFNMSDMISYGTSKVCAECKPVFLQKLSEGVSVSYTRGKRPLPVNPDALIAEVLTRDYHVDVGSCISRGWQLVKANLGITIGAIFLIMLCNQASGFIPFLGVLLSLIVQGPLLGGLNMFFIKLVRGEPAGLGDAFAGFSKRFWPLCGTFLLTVLAIYAFLIPAGAVFIPSMKGLEAGDGFGSMGIVFFVLLFLGLIGMLWLAICFIFAMPLCIDLELGPINAMKTSFRVVSKHWFSVFALVFVAGLVMMLGLLACLVGVLVTMPIFYAATLYAYEDIFGYRR